MRKLESDDELLACGMYVDLNQIRAGEANSIDTSTHTSAYRRLRGLMSRQKGREDAARHARFLSPLQHEGDGQNYIRAGTLDSHRVSDEGILAMSVDIYLDLLDRVGRLGRKGKGKIPADSIPILEKCGFNATEFSVVFRELDSRR